ncbi:transposase [Streptococcus gallolyticus]|uniref:Transposase n=1 Tax=Streptococcus gallolyticus TaxID=315405 RepID=A0AA94S8Z4_9STRE|nr:transposase [Streptococcus gallolyticus subsp. gallolyticus DSM 16831]SQG78586.1 transposase [Streptococcus gallolyticus]
MSKRSPKSVEEKLQCVQSYLNHEDSISQLANRYQVGKSTVMRWIRKYQNEGVGSRWLSRK